MHQTARTMLLLLSFFSILQSSALGVNLTEKDTGVHCPDEMSLQDQISQAQPGSTIQLAAHTYTEILCINKPLHLKGCGADHTLLAPTSLQNSYAMCINAQGVTLSDLTVINHGPGPYATGVKITADQTTIQDCVFTDTPIGIAVWSSQNTIANSRFFRCDDEGIVLLGTAASPCNQNTISSCVFEENCDGIELQYATDNTIEDCRFLSNTHAGIDAIIQSNDHNKIISCDFQDNDGFGVYLASSDHTQISSCTFTNSPVTLIHAADTQLAYSTLASVHLMEDSSLTMTHCDGITPQTVRSHQSTYTILPNDSDVSKNTPAADPTGQHPLLSMLRTRLTMIRTLLERLRQSHL